MKKTLLTLASMFVLIVHAQEIVHVSHESYNQLKLTGAIDPSVRYLFTDNQLTQSVHYSGGTEKNGVCNCMVPLDSTFTLAMLPNDDGSSATISLPFSFDFYGNQYDSVIINNNGNISFLAPYFTFTANAFPDSAYNMIAPFWADVDTRGPNGGNVWYKLTNHAMVVIWDQVGYFDMHDNLLSTFQLIISDGLDSLVPAGKNVSFCYEDMQWTTGDVSSGVGGFGGFPATVGVNVGNGVDYFQVGQFDAAGVAFDGPYGLNDQVDFLDGQEIYFSVAGASSSNTPPVVISSMICDTIDVYTGDTLLKSLSETIEFTISAYAPEINQGLTTQLLCSAPGALTYSLVNSSTEFEQYNCVFNANSLLPGIYTVEAIVEDFGTPAATTSTIQYFRVNYDVSAGLSEETMKVSVFPNPTAGKLTVESNEQLYYQVLDLSGKVLLSGDVVSSEIGMENIGNGMYLLQLINEAGQTSTVKIQKH